MNPNINQENKKEKDLTGRYAAAAGGFAGLTGLVGGVLESKSPGRYDNRRYAADVLKSTGSMAAAGASMGSMFGPIGTWVGATAGTIGGAAMGIVGAEQAKIDQANQDIAYNVGTTAARSVTVSNRERLNKVNTGSHTIPMFDSGTGKFYSNKIHGEHNAMVSPGEAVIGPDGKVEMVPGKYNPKNKDTVKASLEDGSAVLPKNEKFKLPYGKSTTADIAKRISKIDKKSDEIMYGKIKVTSIDRSTAAINKKNTNKAKDNLLKYAELIREGEQLSQNSTGNVPEFDWGGELPRKVSKAAAYGIAASNALSQHLNAVPEKVSPAYMQYAPTEYRSNIGSRVEDIKMRSNIAKYNQSISGRNTGISNSLNAARRYGDERTIKDVLDQESLRLMTQKNADVQRHLGVSSANLAESRRVEDINARSRAAARGIKHSAYANMAEILNPRMYNSARYSEEDLSKILEEMGYKKPGTTIKPSDVKVESPQDNDSPSFGGIDFVPSFSLPSFSNNLSLGVDYVDDFKRYKPSRKIKSSAPVVNSRRIGGKSIGGGALN